MCLLCFTIIYDNITTYLRRRKFDVLNYLFPFSIYLTLPIQSTVFGAATSGRQTQFSFVETYHTHISILLARFHYVTNTRTTPSLMIAFRKPRHIETRVTIMNIFYLAPQNANLKKTYKISLMKKSER